MARRMDLKLEWSFKGDLGQWKLRAYGREVDKFSKIGLGLSYFEWPAYFVTTVCLDVKNNLIELYILTWAMSLELLKSNNV